MITIKGNHISITKGDSGKITFPFKQKCKPFDVNGYTVRFIIKQKGDEDSEAIFDTVLTIDEPTTQLTYAITTTLTSNPPLDYDFALRISKDNEVQTVAEGIFSIVQGVFA